MPQVTADGCAPSWTQAQNAAKGRGQDHYRTHHRRTIENGVNEAAVVTGYRARLLAERAIYVKAISGRFNDGHAWWRIAVRLPEKKAQLAEALQASRLPS